VKRRLPPLTALATAEVIARQNSFTAAAEELHVTPSAISHQIRGLEEWLGFPLFRRDARSVSLTEDGAHYLARVSTLLGNLETITSSAMERVGKSRVFRIQTTDSFATRWLVGRLPKFHASWPGHSVRITTREYTDGFRSADSDLGILYGRGVWPGHEVTPLLSESILPVCSRALLQTAEDETLKSNRLLHDDNLGVSWKDWYAFVGISPPPGLNEGPGLHFNHSHLALQSAEQGNGIVLASHSLVMDALKDGKLVAIGDRALKTDYGYHMVQSREADDLSRNRVLVDWLLSEVSVSEN
jgi:LysR family transcriptional regulator, glycine cleavage system transcriptional activator